MSLGIDVSENQGCIDWKKVKAAGVEYAILRSTKKGNVLDRQLASNIKGCMDNGIPKMLNEGKLSVSMPVDLW